jgi:thiol-disulfide isomerase/thioredoxin
MRTRLSVLAATILISAPWALVVTSASGCARVSPAKVQGASSRPDFHDVAITGIDGQVEPFARALAGRPALVSFWAPWCQPCVKEIPELERLARALQPCGAVVLGVAVGESPQTIAAFARSHQLTYPQLTDEHFQLADALGQSRVPTTAVFDSLGRVVFTGDALDARAIAALRASVGASGVVVAGPVPRGCAAWP